MAFPPCILENPTAYSVQMAAEIKHIADFPDKLNPMVVKELRQGLRGVSFVILFISVQVFLCLILLSTAAGASYESVGSLLSRTIFFFFAVAVLVVQPLRGMAALSGEIKGDTIDLLCLTKLSAWRITFGKWCSIVSQSALILTAIIPYLILRYFFGDMQLFAELLMMLSVFSVSCVLTALTVGLSAINSVILRVLMPLTGAFFLFCGIWVTLVSDGSHFYPDIVHMFTLQTGNDKLIFSAFLIGCVYGTWSLLDFGTSMIAPLSENRATLRRVVSGALVGVILAASYLAGAPAYVIIPLGLTLCVPVTIFSLTEDSRIVPPVCTPFLRWGLAGKMLGRFLYPSWATGLLYVFILHGGLLDIILLYQSNKVEISPWTIACTNSLFAAFYLSCFLTQLFAAKKEKRFQYFLLFLISQCLIVTVIYSAETFSSKLEIMHYFCWVPLSFANLLEGKFFTADGVVTISYITTGIYAILALSLSGKTWKHIHETEKSASQIQ